MLLASSENFRLYYLPKRRSFEALRKRKEPTETNRADLGKRKRVTAGETGITSILWPGRRTRLDRPATGRGG